jgi:hypothetical protein
MTNPNFDQGRSVGEREGIPAYGGPDEAYRLSGSVDQYVGVAGLLPPRVVIGTSRSGAQAALLSAARARTG